MSIKGLLNLFSGSLFSKQESILRAVSLTFDIDKSRNPHVVQIAISLHFAREHMKKRF